MGVSNTAPDHQSCSVNAYLHFGLLITVTRVCQLFSQAYSFLRWVLHLIVQRYFVWVWKVKLVEVMNCLHSCVSGDGVDGGVELDLFEDLGVSISFILFLLCLRLFLYIFVFQVIIDVDFFTILFFLQLQPRKLALCRHLSITEFSRNVFL